MTGRTRALVILQARLGSRRLPGKALSPIGGWPLVQYCIHRLLAARVGDVVLATTTRPEDAALVALARQLGVDAVRGPVNDVLGRFALAVEVQPEAEVILRATGDNPFVDIGTASRVLRAIHRGADYAIEEGLPLGTAVEAVTRDALLQADRDATAPYDREHVTPWIRRAGVLRRVAPLAPAAVRAPDLRLTVDTVHDLLGARYVAAELSAAGWDPRVAPLPDVIDAARRLTTREVA